MNCISLLRFVGAYCCCICCQWKLSSGWRTTRRYRARLGPYASRRVQAEVVQPKSEILQGVRGKITSSAKPSALNPLLKSVGIVSPAASPKTGGSPELQQSQSEALQIARGRILSGVKSSVPSSVLKGAGSVSPAASPKPTGSPELSQSQAESLQGVRSRSTGSVKPSPSALLKSAGAASPATSPQHAGSPEFLQPQGETLHGVRSRNAPPTKPSAPTGTASPVASPKTTGSPAPAPLLEQCTSGQWAQKVSPSTLALLTAIRRYVLILIPHLSSRESLLILSALMPVLHNCIERSQCYMRRTNWFTPCPFSHNLQVRKKKPEEQPAVNNSQLPPSWQLLLVALADAPDEYKEQIGFRKMATSLIAGSVNTRKNRMLTYQRHETLYQGRCFYVPRRSVLSRVFKSSHADIARICNVQCQPQLVR